MSALEGFGKKKTSEKIKGIAQNTARALALAGSLSAGAGIMEAHAQSANPYDQSTITLGGLAQNISYPAKYEALKRQNVTPHLELTVALLAHSAQPDYAAFSDDKSLAQAGQIIPESVFPLVKHRNVGPEYWKGLEEELNSSNLVIDKKESRATEEVKLDILKDISARYDGIDPIELEESIAMVAGNLSIIGQDPTVENVKAEVQKILERRAEVGSKNLFKQNDVLVTSGDEVWGENTSHNGEARFGKKALRDAIHMQMPKNLNMTYWNPFVIDSAPYKSTPESIAEAKRETFKIIETSIDHPLTVVLDIHGNTDSFALSGHRVEGIEGIVSLPEEEITVSEFADSLAKRYQAELQRGHKGLQLSIVSSACEMQNFQRNLAATLRARNIPLPEIMINSSQYGQYGFSDASNQFGNKFNELMVTSPDLGTVMEHKHDVKVSDPSVFVPRDDDPTQIMQISGISAVSASQIG